MSLDDVMGAESRKNNPLIKTPPTLDGFLTEDEKNIDYAPILKKLTKSQKQLLSHFEDNYKNHGKSKMEGLTPKELLGLDELNFAPRTIRYALRNLMKYKFIGRVPNLEDMRQWRYFLTDAYIYSKNELKEINKREFRHEIT